MAQAATATPERAPRTVVKEVPHCRLYSDGTILLIGIRFSHPHVFKPYKGKDDTGDGKFSMVGLMPRTPEYYPARDIMRNRINEIMAENKCPVLNPANKFLRDGNQRPDRPEMLGNYTINASERKKTIVRSNKKDPKTGKAKPLTADDADEIYGGAWGNMLIRPWWQDNTYGKKVNAGLVAVMKTRDDEAFGTGRISEDEVDESFGDLADDESGYDDGLDNEDFDL